MHARPWALPIAILLVAGCDEPGERQPHSTTGTVRGQLTLGMALASALQRPQALPDGLASTPLELEAMAAAARRAPPREAPHLGTTRDGPRVVVGEILVRMDSPGMPPAAVLERVRFSGYEVAYKANVTPSWHLLNVSGKQPLTESETFELAARASRLSRVTAAEANRRAYALASPSDSFYKYQWHLGQIQMPAAWDLSQGSASVVVAVVDNGILAGHPDLQGRLLQGIDMISDPSIAGDGDGRDDNPNDEGRDLANGSSSWHGTHVAGTIGAATNNGGGVAGVDWSCKVLPVRVLGRGGGTLADIAAGMAWAVGIPVAGVRANDRPAQVVNLSLGGDGSASQVYQDVIDEGLARGAVFVVAAGNENEDTANKVPANQRDVITVGAVGHSGDRASYSNFGAEVDLVAPGGEMAEDSDGDGYADGVLSTGYGESGFGYLFMQGTSMAAPHVAGVVALMKARDPALHHAQVEAALTETAVGAYQCSQGCGAGLLNAYAAILKARGQSPQGEPELFVPTRELLLPTRLRASIPVSNRGGGTLTVQTAANGELASRITFPSGATRVLGAAQADAIEVAAETSGLSDGLYSVNVNFDASTAGAVAVRVSFRVGTAAEGKQGFIAALYLDDADEWQVGDGVGFVSAPTVDYRISGLEPREYYLLAGVDDNGNGELFDDGERMGIYLNLDSPQPVELFAGKVTEGVDFALVAVGVAPGEDNRPVPVGAACRTKADCGAGGLCDTTMPGGYCWKECPKGSADCPPGSACFGASSPVCLVTCTSPWSGQASCRSGYLCWDATPAPTCIPPCDDSSCGEGTYCDHATGYCTYR